MNTLKLAQSLKLTIAAAAFTTGLGVASVARAQLFTVEVGPTQFNTLLTQMNTYLQQLQSYTEYGLQAQRWYQTYQHYQQQLVRMQGLIRSFGLPMNQELREVDPNFLVADRCGGGLSLSGLLLAIAPKREGDVVAQQREICVQMQRIQNTKYNETVRFLKSTVPAMEAQVKRIADMRSTDNNNGTVDASTQAAVQTLAELESQMQSWSARMDSYDRYTDTLKETQRQLAQMALKGERNPIGTVVKTSALKAALKVGK
jgi:hypothetical protein